MRSLRLRSGQAFASLQRGDYPARADRGGLSLALADMGDGLDFDQDLGRGERTHLDKGGSWEVAGEELAARRPHLDVVLDVDDVDRDLDHVGHGPARRLDHALDLAEDP